MLPGRRPVCTRTRVHLPPELRAWAADHHGLVTVEAWLAHGQARSSFFRLRNDGLLVPVAPNVAVFLGTEITTLVRIAAGVTAFGPDVMASHRSGAWLRGAPVRGDHPVELLTTRTNRYTSYEGYTIRRPDGRQQLRSTTRHGIATTTPLRTLLDLGATAPNDVRPSLEHFLRTAAVTLPSVRAALARHRRRGRSGVMALHDAIEALGREGVVTDSELEAAMRRVFRRAEIAGWTFHEVVEGYEVDFCFRVERLIVEVDGWAWHGARRDRWERDHDRDLALTALGWLVVRVTWRMVQRQPAVAADRLRAALKSRR